MAYGSAMAAPTLSHHSDLKRAAKGAFMGSSSAHDALCARLRAAGLRATRARLHTLAALQRAQTALSHEALADALGTEVMDRITVYRNLLALTRAGLVRREHGGDRIWRYRLKSQDDLHKRAHPHFSCKACGDTQCLPEEAVRLAGAAKTLEAITSGLEVTLSGQCARCSTPSAH